MSHMDENILRKSGNNLQHREQVDPKPCRLSWLLIKIEPSQEYVIIHIVDLVRVSLKEIYLTRKPRFNLNGFRYCGQLIAASDKKELLQIMLKRLIQEAIDLENIWKNYATTSSMNNWFLVQYMNDRNELIFEIVPKNEISLLTKTSGGRSAHIKKDNYVGNARVLFFLNDKGKVMDELQALREKCEKEVHQDDLTGCIESNHYLLLQYSTGPNTIVYSNLKNNGVDIIWGTENLYPEAVVYIEKKSNVVSLANIMRTTVNFFEAQNELEKILCLALTFNYPLSF